MRTLIEHCTACCERYNLDEYCPVINFPETFKHDNDGDCFIHEDIEAKVYVVNLKVVEADKTQYFPLITSKRLTEDNIYQINGIIRLYQMSTADFDSLELVIKINEYFKTINAFKRTEFNASYDIII